ncbi:hypothetical protein [Massilia agri]|uniref:Uncharacterized protein n=1 Tax=Massilia agri TaxID=1886785 RepID=A0ABT2AU29_9BURK|nr:hypothetical protein [Massilia agri]MCS0599208.1 hypothetical protein [Massilia agri]
MNKPPSLLSLLFVLVLLAVFGVVGAKFMLGRHSASTMSQLGTVWPNIETMPEGERAFLVELAHTCNVTTREPVRAEVVDCLRSVKMNAAAADRLDGLLKQAPAP